jgi:diaminohydroxyphosphoribosylaminopyrimidine deaminase/5-amino-6-(5-phosphoribosylamino)uracil reductase
MSDHSKMMKLAAKQAKKALFVAGDNPRVGCILVKDGKVVGTGFTQAPGDHHAEIMALNESGDMAKGATCYVTLEPCSFHGRTPPCAEALVDAGIAKVIIGAEDPHPKVSGAGKSILEKAGIEVEFSPLAPKHRALNRGFFHRMETGLPFVRLKMAQSLDGRTAMADGDSVWITGDKARRDVQVWRGRSQAILTGVDTVLQDDCRLTVRPENFPKKYANLDHKFDTDQPLRAVLDTHLRTPVTANILQGPGRKIIITASKDEAKIKGLEKAGAEVVNSPKNDDGRIELGPVLKYLGDLCINDVLVECGATLAGQFIEKKLVNQLILYTAPVLMGSSARPLFSFSIEEMVQRHHITNVKFKRLGKDWRILADT